MRFFNKHVAVVVGCGGEVGRNVLLLGKRRRKREKRKEETEEAGGN